MRLEANRVEQQRRQAKVSVRSLAAPPRPSTWLPLVGRRHAELAIVPYANEVRALEVDDFGLYMDLVPDGDRLYAIAQPDRDSLVDLSKDQVDLHCIAELDRVGSTHLFACRDKELMTRFRVVGTEADALAIDIDVFDLETITRPFRPVKQRRMWLERGRGLVAMRDR